MYLSCIILYINSYICLFKAKDCKDTPSEIYLRKYVNISNQIEWLNYFMMLIIIYIVIPFEQIKNNENVVLDTNVLHIY